MKGHCIVNLTAGKGMTGKQWGKIWQTLEQTGFDLTYEFTSHKGHGTGLAQQAVAAGNEFIVAVGGDGTINEVVNGIAGSSVKLGIIPTGTGNDYARTVQIPLDPLTACIVLGTLHTRTVDLAKIGQSYFINVAGIGFDAQVAAEINQGSGFFRGQLAYLQAIMKVLVSYKPLPVQIAFAGQEKTWEIMVVAVANARFYGGGMEIAPQAQVDDGLLDLVVVEKMSKLEFLISLPQLLQGKHLTHPKVKTFRSASFVVSGSDRLKVHADGELLAGLPLKAEIVPRGLEIIVP